MSGRVRVTREGRGLRQYGKEMRCSYGTRINVRESSSAEGSYVWLFMEQQFYSDQPVKDASAHLSVKQARELVRRLQTWLDDVEAPR